MRAELWQWSGDDFAAEGADERPFTLAIPVQLAAVLVVGVWAAALVAGVAVLAVRRLHESSWPAICLRASLCATSSLAAGLAYLLTGGDVAHPALPADVIPMLALGFVYFSTYRLLLTAALPWHGIETDPVVAAGETGLGVLLGLFAARQAWNMLALAPVALLLEQVHARLVATRREVASVLETFATIVDERDPSTYRHSARVAGYIAELAEALGLPPAEVARLRWAGRLHDLGKIAVDAAVLRKPGKLDDGEWAAMRLHPRLSARLLRRFRFAFQEARAVEYHHERMDGDGYYGIEPEEIPLAAHFLIVADSYDAMTSDRPYRDGMPPEVALAEIERNSGRQFHPAIAKAFVALQRGGDPVAALTDEERAELRRLLQASVRPSLRVALFRHEPELVVAGGIVVALFAVGAGVPLLGIPAVVAAAGGAIASQVRMRRGAQLASRLQSILAAEGKRQ